MLGCVPKPGIASTLIDIREGGSNNRDMAKPEARRTDMCIEYYFYEVNRLGVDGGAARIGRRPLLLGL